MAEADPEIGLVHKDQTLTGLLVMSPDQEMPTMRDVVAAMAVYVGETINVYEEEIPVEAPVQWAHRMRVPGHRHDIILWCAQATDQPPAEIFGEGESFFHWVLGIDGLLDYTDPLTSLADLVRMLVTATSHTTAILDLETNRWHGPSALASYFLNTQLEPPAEMLWLVESSASADNSGFNLHTKGLSRCGRRDLELQGLDQSQIEAAVQLMNAIASQSIEAPLPAPPASIEIGHDAVIRVREAASKTNTAEDISKDTGNRAPLIVIDSTADTLPFDLLARLSNGTAALWLPSRDQARRGQLARLTLPHFQQILSDETTTHDASFLVQTSLTDGQAREYVWINVNTYDEHGFSGDLIEDPILECGPKGGDRMIIPDAAVEDWRIESGTTVIVPENIDLSGLNPPPPTDIKVDSE